MFSVGTKIYYKGDQANIEGFGEILTVTETLGYTIAMEDGRVFRWIPQCLFDKNIGQRFFLLTDYLKEREEKINDFNKMLKMKGLNV